jgi:hypothetical protein
MIRILVYSLMYLCLPLLVKGQVGNQFLLVYPNSAEVVPLNDSTLITGDSSINNLISEYEVYEYKSLSIGAKYWPHAVMPHHVYLDGNADTLRERFLSTGHFDSII